MGRARRTSSSHETAALAVMERGVLAVMAKAPRAGQVKTRLSPPLSADEAAELAGAFLLDAVDQVRSVAGARPAIAYAPAARARSFTQSPRLRARGPARGRPRRAALPRVRGPPGRRRARGHRDRERRAHVADRGARGRPRSPRARRPRARAQRGRRLLPDGLREPCAALFADMAWSTEGVFEETMRRARALGLDVGLLPAWFDVDTPADLDRLEAALAAPASGAGPRDASSGSGGGRSRRDGGGGAPARGAGAHGALEALGAVPERAAVGHGARGLQPRRHRLGVLSARPRALARLSLGRGRHRRHLRQPPAPLLRARALERARSDPQGAALRPDRAEGNHGEDVKEYYFYLDSTPTHSYMKCLYKYPQAAFPYERAGRGEPAARPRTSPSSSCSTPASSTRTATSTSSSSTPRPAPRTS